MSGKASRDKGARGEREASTLLKRYYPNAKRGVGQTQAGNNSADVEGTPWWVEVKRQKTRPNCHKAWEQGAGETDGRRVLVMSKADRGVWLVTMSFSTFAQLVEEEDV